MNSLHKSRSTIIALLALATWSCVADVPRKRGSDSIRTSQYVTTRDGTRLAIDIYRPSEGGAFIDKALPVLLMATIDYRVYAQGDMVSLSDVPSYLADILRQGYIVASLEARGQGASFGRSSPGRLETAEDYWDLYDVLEWLAEQPWSNGKIGMFGCSNRGVMQFRAAAVMSPHLMAIAPTAAPVDWAVMGSVNGITARTLDGTSKPVFEPTPVDEDGDRTLLHRAMMEHGAWGNTHANRPYRDAPISLPDVHALPTNWWNLLPNLVASRTPVLQYAGWRDFFSDQAFALYRNLAKHRVPQKLIVGPWYHCEWLQSGLTDVSTETRRWYDHWLRGIDTGYMEEPPIRYYVVGAPTGQEWKSAHEWPLPNANQRTYFLNGQGRLDSHKEELPKSYTTYRVEYHVTTASLATRWHLNNLKKDTANPGLAPILMSELDAKLPSYTSAPMEEDSELTGFPVITLWISSTADDQDFFVYLEEVDATGRSILLTDGAIRASNRITREPPFDNEGLPWHPGYKGDQQRLVPGVPTRLHWALFPFSNYVKKAHRLRVTISGADKGGWISPETTPAPTLKIYHDKQHPSSITIPFVRRQPAGRAED